MMNRNSSISDSLTTRVWFLAEEELFLCHHVQWAKIDMKVVTERYGQILGTSSAYQNKKKCLYQHVFGNI
jgi:hypothetical protein